MEKSNTAQLERNKTIALRFKKSQGTPEMALMEREVLSPEYARVRGGGFHLAANAQGQTWPHPGKYLRIAFPDRVDHIEQIVAEDDRVGLLFRLNATHAANYCGIPPTNRRLNVYELAMLRIRDDQMVEGWFMMDEAELLNQLDATLPSRDDGRHPVPRPPDAGEPPEVVLEALLARPLDTREYENKVTVLRTLAGHARGQHSPRITRPAFPHLDVPALSSVLDQTLHGMLSDHRLRIEALIAEGDAVWARISFRGTPAGGLLSLESPAATVGVPLVLVARFHGSEWAECWCMGDELGLLLQLGEVSTLRRQA